MKVEQKRVIAIEGIDGVGKESVANATTAVLNESGFMAEKVSFPRYDTPIGNICERYLKKEFGHPVYLEPFIASAPYVLDRIQYFLQNTALLSSWDFLILDRSYYTNFIHQGSKFDNMHELAVWMIAQYKSELKMTRLKDNFFEVYFLSLSEEARRKQISIREELDGLESDTYYQQRCVDFIKYTQSELFSYNLWSALKDINQETYYKFLCRFYIDCVKFITVTHVDDSSKIPEANRADATVIANLATRNLGISPKEYKYIDRPLIKG